MNKSEQLSVNFYNWEYKYRGYFIFETPVDIEVPYIAFNHKEYLPKPRVDDGRVPSLFKSIVHLIAPPTVEEESESELLEVHPHYLSSEYQNKLVGLSISFPNESDIQPLRNIEVLNLLSFSEHVISFEIIANSENISIQIVCSEYDAERVQSHLKAYFPSIIIKDVEIEDFNFSIHHDIAIIDFGLNDEFMRPIASTENFIMDPLTPIIGAMESLHQEDTVVFQILFKGITAPLSKDIKRSVSDGKGGSFFVDAPEMPHCAQDKIGNPLFSCVMRVATQGKTDNRSQYLAKELARNISMASQTEFNKLIPLSNEGYSYDFHAYNLHHRLSNRLGFILNSKELNTFVHYPNKTVVSSKLGNGNKKTKAPNTLVSTGNYIGENVHNGDTKGVFLDLESMLSHNLILGSTGTGKSTLIAHMALNTIQLGLGCAVCEPHGDLIEDILKRIPKSRIQDVILIDPADSEFPIGFNLLQANSEIEKIVLISDIVSSFQRHATAWGDTMSSVLTNAVATMLESTKGATLIELKRFLIEDAYRKTFLTSVSDPSLNYYWYHEYPLVKKRIAPLLTRIDTFLRPKLIRYMLAQKNGIDIKEAINSNKIVLCKFSQGLIGESNSSLLSSLFLAKINQAVLARQSQQRESRKPFMLYCDEYQNYITNSIEKILSGSRKYALSLTLANQELSQISDNQLLNSVLSNPKTRICFRLGDADAKRLEAGFSYFDASDLQSLERGQAIMRIGSNKNDFNLQTQKLAEVSEDNTQEIIQHVRKTYAQPRAKVEALLISMLPKINSQDISRQNKETKEKKNEIKIKNEVKTEPQIEDNKVYEEPQTEVQETSAISESQRKQLIQAENKSTELRTHTYLQSVIKKLGQDRNFKATTEYVTKNKGKIDIVLEQDNLKIAFEISETNTPAYEVKNIKKCLKAGCLPVVMVSKHKKHLEKIRALSEKELTNKDKQFVLFIQPDAISEVLDNLYTKTEQQEEVVKGFRIVTEFEDSNKSQIQTIKSRLAELFKRKK